MFSDFETRTPHQVEISDFDGYAHEQTLASSAGPTHTKFIRLVNYVRDRVMYQEFVVLLAGTLKLRTKCLRSAIDKYNDIDETVDTD